MDRLKTIVVGVDFSPSSVAAVRHAVRMARWNGATLHVLHVRFPLAIMPAPEWAELRKLLPKNEWPGDAVFGMPTGNPLDEILRKVVAVEADLLVLGVYGPLGAYTGRGPGSVARQCLCHAPCKTMLIQESSVGPFARVLGCVDFSENSDLAVEQAARIALQDDSELHLLHVAPPEEEDMAESEERLKALQDNLAAREPALKLQGVVVSSRSHGDGILRYAKSKWIDLVVLGVRGKSNLRYILLGGTAERVLRDLPCSALTVKPLEFVSPFTLLERN